MDVVEEKLLDEGVLESEKDGFIVASVTHRGPEEANRVAVPEDREVILDHFDLKRVAQTVGLKCSCPNYVKLLDLRERILCGGIMARNLNTLRQH